MVLPPHRPLLPLLLGLLLGLAPALAAARPAAHPAPQGPDPAAAPPTVAEMQPRINEAIDRGVDWLLLQQHRDGSWGSHVPQYRSGMTALATLTLLKCGLPASHPSIENALRYLARHRPRRTYSAGVLLMVLRALKDDDRYEDWAEDVLEELIEWESAVVRGTYGYPDGAPDLSNTQYAVLGLWAATDMGLDVPLDLWKRLVERTAEDYRGRLEELDWPDDGERRSGRRKLAGFTYRTDANPDDATGSMTTAGLCVMLLAERCAGRKLGGKVTKLLREAKQLGLEWLDVNWSAEKNPNSGGNHLYYLYGVERVGSLLETERLGKHPWYRDGAEVLLGKQRGDGDWGGETDTCFALLFLVRATGPSSGQDVSRKGRAWGTQEGPVHVRVTGDLKLSAWITGFDPDKLAAYREQAPPKDGMRVLRVEYLLDDEVVATVPGDPAVAWTDQRFPVQVLAPRSGKQRMRVRVHVVALGEYPDSFRDVDQLESKAFDVEPQRTPEDFQRASLAAYGEDLLVGTRVTASASSHDGDGGTPDRAVDGMQSTRWTCAAGDAQPRLRIDLDRPMRAGRVVLSPAQANIPGENRGDRVLRVQVTVNDEDPVELDMPEDPLAVLAVDLRKTLPVRSVEVLVLERTTDRGEGKVGWSEVTLEPGPR